MSRQILRTITILIIIQSLIFFQTPVSRAQHRPNLAESIQAQTAAELFVKHLEETGDFARVIDEMYVEDFIERYVQEQIRDGEESNSDSDVWLASGISYKRDLLKHATIEDWRRLYIATNNLYYHIMVIGMNKSADDILNGRELDDEKFEKIFPPKMLTLFNNHPILKDFIEIDEDREPESGKSADSAQDSATDPEKNDKPESDEPAGKPQADAIEKKSGPKSIETQEEMRSVIETLQEGLRMLLEAQNNSSIKPTDEAKKAIKMIIQEDVMETTLRVSDKEYLGFPAGARLLEAPTSTMFLLTLVEVNGKPRIVWAEVFIPDC